MLISQLYRSTSLNDVGFEILQKWYQLPPNEKAKILKDLADELRSNTKTGSQIAVDLARAIGVQIDQNFPPPKKPGQQQP
jgi:hypothetical protein